MPETPEDLLPAGFHDIAARVNTWGRWGPDDERGMLNLVDAAAVRRGAASVVTGTLVPLALALSSDGVQAGLIRGRENPTHRMISLHSAPTGDPDDYVMNDDALDVGTQVSTHWDALAHVGHHGRIYNGFGTDTITEEGASRCGIDRVGPLVTRGVLLDVARALGHDRLEGPVPIGPEELDAALALADVTIEPGDAVLVRTGRMQLFHAGDRVAYAFPSPGLTMQAAPWLHERGVAAVATDTLTFEVFPRRDLGPNGEDFGREDLVMPVHLLHLTEMGLLQGQNWDLEALADICAADGRMTFQLSATPEPIAGGVGAPVAPVATR